MPGKQTWTGGVVVRECLYREPAPPPPCQFAPGPPCKFVPAKRDWTQLVIIGLLALIVILLVSGKAHAQGQNFPGEGGGGGGGTSSDFGSTFPPVGTAVGATDGTNMQPLKVDGSDNLNVNCTVGCSGGSTTPTDAFANPTTALTSFSLLGGFNGTTWDRIRDDANKFLMVDVGNSTLAVTQNGTWNIGTLTTITNSVAVTGTFWQATQPVSNAGIFAVQAAQSGTWTVTGAGGTFPVTQSTSPWIVAGGGTAGSSGTAVLTVQGIGGGTALPVSGTFFQATQPVSCAMASTCPVAATLNAETTKVIGTVNQGTSPWIVAGGGTAGTPGTAVMAVQGVAGGTAVPVSGTVSASGIFEVSPTTAANTLSNQFFTQITNGTNGVTINSANYTSHFGLDNNILGLDGAVFSATNALFGQITDGTNAMGAMTNFGTTPGTVKALNANISVISSLLSNSTVNLAQVGGVSVALGGNTSSASVPVVEATDQGNPCQNPNSTPIPFAVVTSGTSLTQLIPLSASKKIFACYLILTSVSGTTPNYELEYGTATNCGSGTTVLIGPSATVTAGTVITYQQAIIVPASNALCYKMGVTTPVFNISGWYVQQ